MLYLGNIPFKKDQIMTKVLFISLGSAGQRHLRILIKILGTKDAEFFCYRSSKRNLLIDDNLKIKHHEKINSQARHNNITITDQNFYLTMFYYLFNRSM